ncbi:MAG: phage holin family protein [Thermosynechococcaceae cyanobacterium]
MIGILLTLLATALSLLVVDIIFPGVDLANFTAALAGAGVLGGVNAVIRPVLSLLSLPITILSLGAFSLVINGLCFWLAALLVPGFKVSGILSFIVGPIILSVVSTFFSQYLTEKYPQLMGGNLPRLNTDDLSK